MIARLVDQRIVPVILYSSVVLTLLLFYLPILALIAFSFRAGRHLVLPFDGVTLDWYRNLFRNADFVEATAHSAAIAAIVMVASTVCGTLLAIAAMRFRFRFKMLLLGLNLAPIFFPQLLLGIVLLLWFSVLGSWFDFSLGFSTVVVGHIVYVTPFAAIVVAVRLAALDEQLDDAARDCGARSWQVYRYVTLPLLWPGILSAAIFSFLLSWSNFYISFNLSGTTPVLPVFVYAGLAFNSSPTFPAIATVFFLPMIVLVVLAERLRRRAVVASPMRREREAYA